MKITENKSGKNEKHLTLDDRIEIQERLAKGTRSKENGFSLGSIIPVLLTDNGGEFSNVSAFENDGNEYKETSLFFCEPASPDEKPRIEKNHALFRDIVPSGRSFDEFTQENVNLIFPCVNSVKRKQFGGKSTYDFFTFLYSEKSAHALGVAHIEPTDVIQSPLLLKNLCFSFQTKRTLGRA